MRLSLAPITLRCLAQVFVHAPLLRNFFLGEGHPPHRCHISGAPGAKPCLGCELVREVYLGFGGRVLGGGRARRGEEEEREREGCL